LEVLGDAMTVFISRYQIDRRSEDLNVAIELCEAILEDSAVDSDKRPVLLGALAINLQERYVRTSDWEDQERNLGALSSAVDQPRLMPLSDRHVF
jgi:hypothetical protein